jgi:hypothetical protein
MRYFPILEYVRKTQVRFKLAGNDDLWLFYDIFALIILSGFMPGRLLHKIRINETRKARQIEKFTARLHGW